MAKRGYEALTMRELARESRVTVPTLYNLIGGKEAVLAAAVEEQTARFLGAIERRAGQSPATRLLAVFDACTRELLGLPAYYRSLLHLLYRAEAASRVRTRVDRALGSELAGALGAIADAGELIAWADSRELLRSLRSQLGANALAWASGVLADDAFSAAACYDVCLTLLGVTTGRSHAELERAARKAQAAPGRRTASGASKGRSLKLRHPTTGAIYTAQADGLVRVEHEGRAGLFTARGEWRSGELRDADLHLLGWVGGPNLAPRGGGFGAAAPAPRPPPNLSRGAARTKRPKQRSNGMDLGLSGKKALVTAATRGIGLSIARAFADEGVDIALCARAEGGLESARKDLEARGVRVFAKALDVADKRALEAFIGEAGQAARRPRHLRVERERRRRQRRVSLSSSCW